MTRLSEYALGFYDKQGAMPPDALREAIMELRRWRAWHAGASLHTTLGAGTTITIQGPITLRSLEILRRLAELLPADDDYESATPGTTNEGKEG